MKVELIVHIGILEILRIRDHFIQQQTSLYTFLLFFFPTFLSFLIWRVFFYRFIIIIIIHVSVCVYLCTQGQELTEVLRDD